ncbi:MAG: hypothetical protein KAI71_01020 [Candidatus Pacebacteria bacterium]|nr:hypothetical protein [Candidatus Paceibacterota bacterium]
MKIEKTIKSLFDNEKTLKILDDCFVSIGYKKTVNEKQLIYERGSFSGSLFLTPKFWKSTAHIDMSGRKKNVIVKINVDINTTGQMVIKKERDFLENEFNQIESVLLNLSKEEYNKYKDSNNFLTSANQKTANRINSSQQKDTMISLSEFPRLKVVALIFIALGIAEVIFIINALTSGQNFATSFIFVFYAFVGFKLLLLKKGIKLKTYESARNLISFIFVLTAAVIPFEIIDSLFFFLVKSPVILERDIKDIGNLIFPTLFFAHLALVYLLNRPLIKQREVLSKPIKQSLFVGGVVLATLFMCILSGPHLIKNHFQIITDVTIANQQVKEDVGDIEKLILNKKEGVFNWVLFSEWNIVGSKCVGTYDIEVSSKNEVTFQIKKLQCPEDNQQTQNREYTPSLIKDVNIKQSSEPTDGILLSTSFENLDFSNSERVAPFINNKGKWQLYAKDSKTGKYSLNVLPNGNFPARAGLSFFSSFPGENQSNAILNSVFSNKYEPFDVSDYDRIEFDFWRYSSSNPRKKDDWNCAGNLDLKYKIDKGEWKTAMCYCGEHRTETRGWRFSSLTFNTKGKSTIEFKFEYDAFLIREEDSTAFYLIDDLQIKGFKGDPFQ